MMAVSGYNHWAQLAKGLKPAVQKAVTETAIGLQEDAKGNAPVDTGFLASSIYSVTPGYGSTYDEAQMPPGDSYQLPEVTPDNDTSAIVGVSANYGIYVNYGHHTRSGSWVPAQPFWEPAIDAARALFDDELAKIWSGLGGSIR